MYKNKERKINYPHQKTVVTSTIVRTQNFNNSGLLRVNHSIVNSNSTNNPNGNASINAINNQTNNNNIHPIYNSHNGNNFHNTNYNQHINRNNNLRPKNNNVNQGTQPSSEERRLEQRQKQIEYGKNTIGYKIYIKTIKKENRKKTDPWTPDKYTKCSKRCWDGMVRSWRRQLHNWDPVDDDSIKMNTDQSNGAISLESNKKDVLITNNLNQNNLNTISSINQINNSQISTDILINNNTNTTN